MVRSRSIDPGRFRRADLERIGFRGFIAVGDLRASRPVASEVPGDAVGVYVVYRDSAKPIAFNRVSPAGTWRGDPTLPLATLRSRWVAESPIVYIGKAGRPRIGSSNSLRKRVSAYIRFGAGSNARHWGGYPTWQIADASALLIAWRFTNEPETAAGLEAALIGAHLRRFGAMPFANSIAPSEAS